MGKFSLVLHQVLTSWVLSGHLVQCDKASAVVGCLVLFAGVLDSLWAKRLVWVPSVLLEIGGKKEGVCC